VNKEPQARVAVESFVLHKLVVGGPTTEAGRQYLLEDPDDCPASTTCE
jgi:hypothetical protein